MRGPGEEDFAEHVATALRFAFVNTLPHPNGQDLRAWDSAGGQYRLKMHPATGWVLIERELTPYA